LANDYPREVLEIVVVDGMSTDRTREIVDEYCQQYLFIKMIDNPWHIKPKALNIGIKSTKSDVVMRIDAHALYAKDYISKLVRGLFQYNADNIGGVRETYSGDTPMANAIAVGISHPFSVGNAYWRTGTKNVRKVDTVFCGCYRREIFDRIGLFNEELIRTQDKEFNSRLMKNGGVIILDPSVRCTYFPRTKIADYIKWNFTGASWLFYARRFTSINMTSWKNYVPLIFLFYSLFFLTMLFCSIPSQAVKITIAIPLLVYLSLSLYFSVEIAFKKQNLLYMPLLFLIFPATHYSYALGSLYGIIKAMVLGKDVDT
jgi:glycosyltransferase involved in cell wall biosynthesis